MIDFEKEKRFRDGTYTAEDCENLSAEQIMHKSMGKRFTEKKCGVSRNDCFIEMMNNPLFAAIACHGKGH